MVLGDSLWRMVLGVWFWAYAFGRIVLGVWVWGYGWALGVWFWVYGFGCIVLGVLFGPMILGHSLANEGRPSSNVYTYSK